MHLIYRTGQPTKRRFFFLLSKLKLHVTGNEAPAWRGGKEGEAKGGKIGMGSFLFFFFFNVFASHEDSAKLARGRHGTAHPSKRLGWAVQVEYVSGL